MPLTHSSTLFCCITLAFTAITGCVERLITVRSQPPGSLVYLNDEEVGRTPVTVPFKFYGTYDVRLEHEGEWVSQSQAAQALSISEEELQKRIDDQKLDGRNENGQALVRLYYAPLWTKQEAAAPWWEYPGPDLVGEAIPGNKVQLEWDFTLEPIGDKSSQRLIDRAKQMRALIKQQSN